MVQTEQLDSPAGDPFFIAAREFYTSLPTLSSESARASLSIIREVGFRTRSLREVFEVCSTLAQSARLQYSASGDSFGEQTFKEQEEQYQGALEDLRLRRGDIETEIPTLNLRASQPNLLSPRQYEVMDLIASGVEPSAIPGILYISPSTLKSHLRSVHKKLGVHTTLAAVLKLQRKPSDL